jgi:hypothetical protein
MVGVALLDSRRRAALCGDEVGALGAPDLRAGEANANPRFMQEVRMYPRGGQERGGGRLVSLEHDAVASLALGAHEVLVGLADEQLAVAARVR